MPCARVVVWIEPEDHSLVVTATRVRPAVGGTAARHIDVTAHLDAGTEKLESCAAVELETEIDLGVAHFLAVQCSGKSESEGLTEILVDPGAGLAGPLTVLADTYSMILQTGERILVGLGC